MTSGHEVISSTELSIKFIASHEKAGLAPAVCSTCYNMSLVMRKLDFCKCENKDADQLRSNCKGDQRLVFAT